MSVPSSKLALHPADHLRYYSGFGNEHATEAVSGALPVDRILLSAHLSVSTQNRSTERRLPLRAHGTAVPGCIASVPP